MVMAGPQPRTSSLTDAELLARARQSDGGATEELCQRYREPLIRFCFRYLRHGDAAEDAAHDVLTRVTVERRWPDHSFRAWIYRAARNHCLNLRQRRGNRDVAFGSGLGESGLASPHTGPRTAADRNERQAALRAALDALPSELAEVLAMRYFEELTRREMARVLEVGEGVVKQRLVQARTELARKLEGSGEP